MTGIGFSLVGKKQKTEKEIIAELQALGVLFAEEDPVFLESPAAMLSPKDVRFLHSLPDRLAAISEEEKVQLQSFSKKLEEYYAKFSSTPSGKLTTEDITFLRDLPGIISRLQKIADQPRREPKDGYTPRKGVDYFDGRDGKDGKDGSDATLDPELIGKLSASAVEVHEETYDHTKIHSSFLIGSNTLDEKGMEKGMFLQYAGDGLLKFARIKEFVKEVAKEFTPQWNNFVSNTGPALPSQHGHENHVLRSVAGEAKWTEETPGGGGGDHGDLTGLGDDDHTQYHTDARGDARYYTKSEFDAAVAATSDVTANTAARHTHANQSVLDATTASFTTAQQTKLSGIETGATADQVASEVPVTPSGNLASSDAQAAFVELQGDIDSINSSFAGLDTDDVDEATNLYFTSTRAKTAVVLNTLAGSETDQAPSVSAVNTALATKAASSHTHAAGDTTSGTFADARISQSSVTQHQAALAITESQISDLKHTAAVGGILSLVSGQPSYVADQSAKSTLYYTPYYSNTVAIWSGSAWVNREFSEISLALSSLTSGKNYDVFLNWSGSAVALSLGTAWTNDTTRATALATQNGISVKSGDAGYRYVGTIRTSGTTTTDDSATSRFLYNHYNAIKKPSLTGYRVHFDAYSLVVGDETPLHIIGEAYVTTTEGTAATHTTAQELATQQRVTFTLTETRNVYATAKAEGDTATAGNAAVLLVDPSTGTPEEYARYVNPGGLGYYGTIFGKKKYTLAAGTYTFKLMFRCTAAQQARFQNRILEIALA